ncbi:putative glycosyltransferase EpsE [Spirochaetia bacterium]|nr:putative glycosyltransferase EpsE [Spirochaetia bacterium]
MSKDKPLISVIMGIYNCALTLSESIDSLLNQTYKDFELIMCDDGSLDNTYYIAKQYADKYDNIVLLKNDTNRGLNYTLNHCLKYANGEYIARQDGDDISLPERFQKEVDFLDNNPTISLVSCPLIRFDEKGDFCIEKAVAYPDKMDFIHHSPFRHASCMIRKSVMDSVNGYSESKWLLRVEDYHLWFKIYAKGYRGHNIQQPLYKARDDVNAFKRRTLSNRINCVYVRFIGYKMLHIPFYYYIFCFHDIIAYLLPKPIYNILHKKNTIYK